MAKRKPLALIIAKMKKEGSSSEEPMDEPAGEDYPEMDEGLLASAEEAMSAVEAGDAMGFAEALKAFIYQCE